MTTENSNLLSSPSENARTTSGPTYAPMPEVQTLAGSEAATVTAVVPAANTTVEVLTASSHLRTITRPLPPALASNPDPMTLAKGLRRRWMLAVVVAILGAFLSGFAAWQFVPAQFNATVLFRIKPEAPKILFDTVGHDKRPIDTFFQSQVAFLKSEVVISSVLRKPEIADLPFLRDQLDPVGFLTRNLAVERAGSPEIMRLSLIGDDPKAIADVVNAVKDAYLDLVANEDIKKRQLYREDLEKIYSDSEVQLQTRKQKFRDLVKNLGSSDAQALTLKQKLALEYYGRLRNDHAQTTAELLRANIGFNRLKTLLNETGKGAVPKGAVDAIVEQDPLLLAKYSRIAEVRELLTQYEETAAGKARPEMVRYAQEIATLEKDIEKRRKEQRPIIEEQLRLGARAEHENMLAEAQEKVLMLTEQQKAYQGQLSEIEKDIRVTGTGSADLELMRVGIEQEEKLVRRMQEELQTLRIELQSPPRVSELMAAQVPKVRDSNRRNKVVPLAAVAGGCICLLGLALMEFRTRRINNAEEVVYGLGMRLVGAVPILPARARRRALSPSAAPSTSWQSRLTESIDAIRTMLIRETSRSGLRVIMVASAESSEGKTTLCTQLAASIARSGVKIAVVDFDLRNPNTHHVFKVKNRIGISDWLREEASLAEIIQSTGVPGLSLLPAGKANRQTILKLAQGQPKLLFDQLRNEFDMILVDSAPVLPVADSLAIGQHVDAVIMAIRGEHSRAPKVYEACERFISMGVPILGSVIIALRGNGYYSYSYTNRYYQMSPQVERS